MEIKMCDAEWLITDHVSSNVSAHNASCFLSQRIQQSAYSPFSLRSILRNNLPAQLGDMPRLAAIVTKDSITASLSLS